MKTIRSILFLTIIMMMSCVYAQHVVDYGDSTELGTDTRIIPPSVSSLIFTNPHNREIVFLQHTDSAAIVIANWSDCPVPNFPLPIGGKTGKATYMQLHHFNCDTDSIIVYAGAVDTDSILWVEADSGYRYHYLIFYPGDSTTVRFGIAFRTDRFYGSFSIERNVIYSSATAPFAIVDADDGKASPEESDRKPYEFIYDFSGRLMTQGFPGRWQRIIPRGTYVRRRLGVPGLDKIFFDPTIASNQ